MAKRRRRKAWCEESSIKQRGMRGENNGEKRKYHLAGGEMAAA